MLGIAAVRRGIVKEAKTMRRGTDRIHPLRRFPLFPASETNEANLNGGCLAPTFTYFTPRLTLASGLLFVARSVAPRSSRRPGFKSDSLAQMRASAWTVGFPPPAFVQSLLGQFWPASPKTQGQAGDAFCEDGVYCSHRPARLGFDFGLGDVSPTGPSPFSETEHQSHHTTHFCGVRS